MSGMKIFTLTQYLLLVSTAALFLNSSKYLYSKYKHTKFMEHVRCSNYLENKFCLRKCSMLLLAGSQSVSFISMKTNVSSYRAIRRKFT